MGEYFLIANIDKRQYLSAASMNENSKRNGFLSGLHGRALGLLVCRSDELRHGYGDLAGSWYGDHVIATGDDNGVPDAYGVITSGADAPDRNLFHLAVQTYEDISLAAIAMLCRGDQHVTAELAEAAAGGDPAALQLVGDAVFVAQSRELEAAMGKRLGKGWVGRYRACDASSFRGSTRRSN